jgi:hypothetical protein
MNNRQQATLTALAARPVRLDIRWLDVVSLFRALGATVDEGRAGSRVGIHLRGSTIIVHRPHPRPVLGPETVRSLQRFLREARVATTGDQPGGGSPLGADEPPTDASTGPSD